MKQQGATESFLRELTTAIHSVDSNLPLAQTRTLHDVYQHPIARTSFTLILLGIAATMALALAAPAATECLPTLQESGDGKSPFEWRWTHSGPIEGSAREGS